MGEVKLVSGHGVYLDYSDGTEVIDASNTGCPLGHAHPAMVEAVREAAYYPVANEGQPWFERELAAEELASQLNAAAGSDWVGEVVFGLSGSEVNDIALSFAQALTGRSAIATRERAYHGLVGLSRDVTVQPQWHCGLSFTNPPHVQAPPTVVDVRIIPAPDGAVWERSESESLDIGAFEAECEQQLCGAAAVIVDYTQGGRYYEGPEYQDALARAARKSGALWVADEVVTGLGRGGTTFAFSKGTTIPDILTLGKPLSGGATPAGAVVLSKSVVEAMGNAKWQNYSTFRGHPVMVHAMRQHLRLVKEEALPERASFMGARLQAGLTELANAHFCVTRIAGNGLHWTVEFEGKDWRSWTSTEEGVNISDIVVKEALSAGVRISTSDEPSSLFLAPPLIISEKEIDCIVAALDKGLVAGDRFIGSSC
ncbi:MAG: aminotransferase class III-fold pyridoxal phosphate-dependent enzyme [Ellagibacter isourolithinifaciens]|uniref:aminotransferase class III-fold pyridoxal phosphate-dependent enzyme n=1 Tax=Ellagibacter isourolithinifaciens TaxID=2137581 RepID=UPI002E797578|nr:aminotransferase class III-fold pyridoxal phosphate-dependent enzyme [Ellagibacter isourolithinifaciens]MEE1454021.1 aminotransferase class III-fold pyridoxal phosphate-dependent enzyme [Ellagibacter isourolithinifaciens]